MEKHDHFRKPRNTGTLTNPDGSGRAANPVYGDTIELHIKVKDNVITDAAFKAFGCTEAVASCSFITDMIKNKTVNEAEKISAQDIANELGLSPERMRCSILAEEVLKNTIRDYRSRNNQ